jgi:hypothetical protein
MQFKKIATGFEETEGILLYGLVLKEVQRPEFIKLSLIELEV